MSRDTCPHKDYQEGRWWALGVLIAYGIVSRMYVVLRYGSFSVLGDGAFFTRAAESVIATGSVSSQVVYPAGFGYQTVLAFVSELTGIAPLTIQLYVAPFLGLVPLLASYALFRSLLGKTRSAFVALVALAIVPDFLSITSRSTHEVLTISLFVTELLVLHRIMFDQRPGARKLIWTVLWWMVFLGILTLNIVFAYVAMIVSVVLVITVESGLRRLGMRSALSRQSWWSFVATSLALTFFYAWYIYPAASYSLVDIHRNLIFVSEILAVDQVTAYEFVQSTWTSVWIWIGLTLSLWVLFGASGIEWIHRVRLLLFRKREQTSGVLFMIGALAILGLALVLSIAADFVTTIGNAQYRMLPLVLIISAPLAVLALGRIWQSAAKLRRSRTAAVVVVVALTLLSTTSLLKATTDPSISKYWTFYSPDELAGVMWIHNQLQGQSIWADVDSRILRLSWMYTTGPNLYDVTYVNGIEELSGQTHCYLMDSALIRERVSEYGGALTIPSQANLVYQNGRTEIWDLC